MKAELSFTSLLFIVAGIHEAAAQSSYSVSSFDSTKIQSNSVACNQAYQTIIPGCSSSDFIASNPCSQACLAGLNSIQDMVVQSCKGVTVPNTSMLAYFAAGRGTSQVCTALKMTAAGTSAQPTTLATSIRPTATAAPETAPKESPAAEAPKAGETAPAEPKAETPKAETAGEPKAAEGSKEGEPAINGGDTKMSLPSGTVIAIVVVVVIVSAVGIIVGISLYSKYYTSKPK